MKQQNKINKPASLSWLILTLAIILAQLFNEPYQYFIASIITAFFIAQLSWLTHGKIIEKNGYIYNINLWGYLWRTITFLIINTIMILTIAMIFFPGQFIYYRLTTLVIIVFSHMLTVWLYYRQR